ncbi:MAG: hypothetical protein LBP59_01405 [Planctomycetaceae bacterium]|nr:hypothetical protein [Planctomycetaceae bacterium]
MPQSERPIGLLASQRLRSFGCKIIDTAIYYTDVLNSYKQARYQKPIFKLFVLEFAFIFACLDFRRQALTLLNR